MDITICGHRRAAEILSESPNQLDIIFITSPDAPFAVAGADSIPGLAREICEIRFHDVSQQIAHLNPPDRHHVQKALDFAKGRDKLIVACQAGISRSSATAYVIQASEVGSKEALKILDPAVHNPNAAVIRHGSVILDDPEMIWIVNEWKSKAEEAQWDGPFHV